MIKAAKPARSEQITYDPAARPKTGPHQEAAEPGNKDLDRYGMAGLRLNGRVLQPSAGHRRRLHPADSGQTSGPGLNPRDKLTRSSPYRVGWVLDYRSTRAADSAAPGRGGAPGYAGGSLLGHVAQEADKGLHLAGCELTGGRTGL